MGQFDTQLTPEQEIAYRKWMMQIGHTPENGMAVDSNFTGTDYDYRGFFAKNGPVAIGQGQHFNDEFKKPNHPSFSTGSIYSKPGFEGGTWMGNFQQGTPEYFVPSSFNRLVSVANAQRMKSMRKK